MASFLFFIFVFMLVKLGSINSNIIISFIICFIIHSVT